MFQVKSQEDQQYLIEILIYEIFQHEQIIIKNKAILRYFRFDYFWNYVQKYRIAQKLRKMIKNKDFHKATKKRLNYYQQISKKSIITKDNDLHVTWNNVQGIQCKRIIQPNRCFCTHSFSCHQTPKTIGMAYCLAPGCKCKCYQYVPYFDVKCMCRHSYKDHDRNSKKCNMCKKCLGFITNWCCKCGMKYQMHQTVFQRKINTNLRSSRERNNRNNTVQLTQPQIKKVVIDDNSTDLEQQNKQNISTKQRFSASRRTDARSYELNKFNAEVGKYYRNQKTVQLFKQKQIERINQKYSNIDYEKHVQKYDEDNILGLSKIYKPQNARKVTPLQLIIRPHNYSPVKLQKILQKQYKKYELLNKSFDLQIDKNKS